MIKRVKMSQPNLSIEKKHGLILSRYSKQLLTLMLLALMSGIPLLGLKQNLTGPLINCLLFISTYLLGLKLGVLLGTFSASSALARGLLLGSATSSLALVVPFIILGNATLCLTFAGLHRRNLPLAFISAALTKFLVIYLGVHYLATVLFTLPAPLLAAMGTLQLGTALSGGLMAYLVIRPLAKRS